MYQKEVRQGYLLGNNGLERLRNAHVAVYGLGGSGSPIVLQLAHLGVGNISIIDPDIVDESNLNRQVLYEYDDIGSLKIDAAKSKIQRIDRRINVYKKNLHSKEDLDNFLKDYCIVVDAVDNYRFKVLLDRKCRALNIPMIHTSAVGMRGTVVTFMDNESSYEKYFDLPSLNRNVENVTDHEFEERRRKLVEILVGDFYPSDIVTKIQKQELSWQTLVPAPIIASGVVVSEIIRIILGIEPMHTPSNPFNFNYKFDINEIN